MNPIVVKSNAHGLLVRLDGKMSFEELEKAVREKFAESADFFKKGKMAVAFEGRKLSAEEEFNLVKAISEAGKLTVTCVIENDKAAERAFGQKVEEKMARMEQGDGQFYKGTLRNGQVLEAESSLIILGDVNPGATVYSAGNVVILGTLAGSVYAGGSGTESAFVAALDMHPMQIRIGDVIARGADKRSKKEKPEPKIAFVEDGNIYIEKISREVINDLPLL